MGQRRRGEADVPPGRKPAPHHPERQGAELLRDRGADGHAAGRCPADPRSHDSSRAWGPRLDAVHARLLRALQRRRAHEWRLRGHVHRLPWLWDPAAGEERERRAADLGRDDRGRHRCRPARRGRYGRGAHRDRQPGEVAKRPLHFGQTTKLSGRAVRGSTKGGCADGRDWMNYRRIATFTGWLWIITFLTSIPARLFFYAPV